MDKKDKKTIGCGAGVAKKESLFECDASITRIFFILARGRVSFFPSIVNSIFFFDILELEE